MKSRLGIKLESQYPKLTPDSYKVTSKRDKTYNCVGWAAQRDVTKWWEPLNEPGCYWPNSVPFDPAFKNYLRLFEVLGYYQCDNQKLEDGFEKIVIFKDVKGWFTHVSHQLDDGRWTSKLGHDEDINHNSNEVLEERAVTTGYGTIAVIMKRKRQIWQNAVAAKPVSESGIRELFVRFRRWCFKGNP